MVLVPLICFRLVSFLKAIIGNVVKFFYNYDLLVKRPNVFLEYLLDLITPDYMLLKMVYIVFHDVSSVGVTVVIDRVGQLSEFSV